MLILFYVLIVLVALIHALFFKIESLDFMKPKTLKAFGLKEDQARLVKVWAFNQGFYNLFLALGLFFGLFIFGNQQTLWAIYLIRYILIFICLAGLILYISAPKKLKFALIQSFPALLAFILSFSMPLNP